MVGLLQAEVRRLDDQNRALTKLMESDQFFLKAITDRLKALDEQRTPDEKLRKPHSDEMIVADALHINLLKREYLLGKNLGIITAARRRDTLVRRDMSDQKRADLVSQLVQVSPQKWVHEALAADSPATTTSDRLRAPPEPQVTTRNRTPRRRPQTKPQPEPAITQRQQPVRSSQHKQPAVKPRTLVQQRLPDGTRPKMSFEEGLRVLRLQRRMTNPLEKLEQQMLQGPQKPGTSSDEN